MNISRRNALKLAALGIVSAATNGRGAMLKPPIVGVKADQRPLSLRVWGGRADRLGG